MTLQLLLAAALILRGFHHVALSQTFPRYVWGLVLICVSGWVLSQSYLGHVLIDLP